MHSFTAGETRTAAWASSDMVSLQFEYSLQRLWSLHLGIALPPLVFDEEQLPRRRVPRVSRTNAAYEDP